MTLCLQTDGGSLSFEIFLKLVKNTIGIVETCAIFGKIINQEVLIWH